MPVGKNRLAAVPHHWTRAWESAICAIVAATIKLKMAHDRILELERQTAVAFAALGTSFGAALEDRTVPAATTMVGAFAESFCEEVEHSNRRCQ